MSGARRLLLEGAVMVGSILLAFAIDAWWDGRQQGRQRAEVATSLIADFESARTQLAVAIVRSQRAVERTEALLRAAGGGLRLPQDSIVSLALDVVIGEPNPPSLPRYRATIAAGQLNLLQSDSLLVALSDFARHLADYRWWQDQRRGGFVNGALHELRRELGTLSVLNPRGGRMPAPERFAAADLNEVIQRRSVYAAIEPIHVARFNYHNLLVEMDSAAVRVLSAIRRIDSGV